MYLYNMKSYPVFNNHTNDRDPDYPHPRVRISIGGSGLCRLSALSYILRKLAWEADVKADK